LFFSNEGRPSPLEWEFFPPFTLPLGSVLIERSPFRK